MIAGRAAYAPWSYTHKRTRTCAGVLIEKPDSAGNPSGKGGSIRGEITEFSTAASRRMRLWLLLKEVPGAKIMESTFTIPGELSREEWDKAWHLFCQKVRRSGAAMVWRVELQKRKQPHVHCIAYLPPNCDQIAVEEMFRLPMVWFSCLPDRCIKVPGAWLHAVRGSQLKTMNALEWLRYCAAHSSKHKVEQLGWLGKQWGVVNRGLFSDRPAKVEKLQYGPAMKLKRWVSAWVQSKIKESNKFRFRGIGIRGWSRIMDPVLYDRLEMLAKSFYAHDSRFAAP